MSDYQDVFHNIAMYVHKKHKVEFAIIKKLLNLLEANIAIGPDETKHNAQKLLDYENQLERIVDFKGAVWEKLPQNMKLIQTTMLQDSQKERKLEEELVSTLKQTLRFISSDNEEQFMKELRIAEDEIEKLEAVIQEYESDLAETERMAA